MSLEAASKEFRRRYGREPEIMSIAPGRINLIGEHTDYNDGFVFPAAIDKRVYVASSPSDEGRTELYSLELGVGQGFDARSVVPGDVDGWSAYAAGMAWILRESIQTVSNICAVVSGDVPIGSGVSSSAALELAFGATWTTLCAADMPPRDLAQLAQKCENEFVGVQSGIMDQMASAMGKAGYAMFLDTRSLEIRYAPMPPGLSVVVCDTKKPRNLVDSAYNERRAQCEEASRLLGVPSLRDADMRQLDAKKPCMDEVVFRRARHVITENARCVAFAGALETANLREIGALMRASHESLRNDYEVSCTELDLMAEAAWAAPGCVGARMTGAGFGGACVALVDSAQIPGFTDHVLGAYRSGTGTQGEILPCSLSDGAKATVTQGH